MKPHLSINKLIIVIIGVSILFRLFILVVAPCGATVLYGIEGLNDEPAHLNYVRYLATQRSFPVQTESTRSPEAFVHNVFEYYQPPLYYLMCASVYPLAGENGILYWGRAFSFLFGIATLLIMVNILKMIGIQGRLLILAVTFASFQLSHVYFCSMLSNDSLSWLISMLIVNLMVRKTMRISRGLCFDIWIGVLLALGMLVKSSTAIFFPVYIMLLLYEYKTYRKIPLKQIGIITGAIFVVAPWYMRNYLLYNSIFAFEIGFGPPGISSLHLGNIHTALNATVRFFFFPMQHVPVTFVFKLVNYAGVALVVAHISMISVHIVKLLRTDLVYRIALLIVGLAVCSYVMLLTKWFNAEGRYLFSGFGPMVMLLFPVHVEKIRLWRYLKIIVIVEIAFGYIYFFLV
ncbi:MAG: hypothetical protein JW915_09915 [Chitinispirillaceae bacterium]|nr:hypothetical protein [Chitinispirillaceae bacterium]